jgi:hypothetical protein
LGYSSSNILVLGYGQQTKGPTQIYGTEIRFKTNGDTNRLVLTSSGDASFSGNIVLANAKYIYGANNQQTPENVQLLGLNGGNEFWVGYGAATKSYPTIIAGDSLSVRLGTSATQKALFSSDGLSVNGGVAAQGVVDLSHNAPEVTEDIVESWGFIKTVQPTYNASSVSSAGTTYTPHFDVADNTIDLISLRASSITIDLIGSNAVNGYDRILVIVNKGSSSSTITFTGGASNYYIPSSTLTLASQAGVIIRIVKVQGGTFVSWGNTMNKL